MKCNHDKCETPYCPYCGCELTSSAEARVREYFRKNVRKHEAIVEKAMQDLNRPNERPWNGENWRENNLEQFKKVLACWQGRLDDFEAALDERGKR